MKIAEALIERKRIQQLMESNKVRVVSQAKIYEGDETVDDVVALSTQIVELGSVFGKLTKQINKTNQTIIVRDEKSISDLIAEKDGKAFTKNKLEQIYKAAVEKIERYGRSSDVKIISTIDVVKLRKVIDCLSSEINQLNIELQRYNWTYDLLED